MTTLQPSHPNTKALKQRLLPVLWNCPDVMAFGKMRQMLGRNQFPCRGSGQTDRTWRGVVKRLPVRDSSTLWNFIDGYAVREIWLLDTGDGHESSTRTGEEMGANRAQSQSLQPSWPQAPRLFCSGNISEHTGELNSMHPLIKKDFAWLRPKCQCRNWGI